MSAVAVVVVVVAVGGRVLDVPGMRQRSLERLDPADAG